MWVHAKTGDGEDSAQPSVVTFAWEPLPVLILLSLSLFLQVTLLPLQAGCLLFGRDSTLASAACLNVDFLSRALAFG